MSDRLAPAVSRAWPQRGSAAMAGRAPMVGPGKGVTIASNSSISNLNLAFWFKSDAGISKDGLNKVSVWADLSANGRDLAQGTGTAQPFWQANQVNGLPAVLFDGADDKMFTATFSLPQPFCVYTLYKEVAHSNTEFVWTTDGIQDGVVPRPELFMHLTLTRLAEYGVTTGPGVTPGTAQFRLVRVVVDGASSVASLDNGPEQTGTGITGNAGRLFSLGGDPATASASNINVAEVIGVNGFAAGADAVVMDYLKQTYGLW